MRRQQAANRRSEQGSVLVVTLFITTMFGMFLGSYFYLARQQNNLVMRSQAWNATMGMAEAGAEEALAQLNPGASLWAWGAPHYGADLTANGWGNPVGGLYGPMTRSLPVGSTPPAT